jgi:Na+-transporting NADH:ubiquinone oxidoreductase subunit NqrE
VPLAIGREWLNKLRNNNIKYFGFVESNALLKIQNICGFRGFLKYIRTNARIVDLLEFGHGRFRPNHFNSSLTNHPILHVVTDSAVR